MTVKQLREMIKGYPDNVPIILQKDPEGNGYSPLVGVEDAFYLAETGCRGQAYTDKDDMPPEATRCVILFPNG